MRFPITKAVDYSPSFMLVSGCTLCLSNQGEQSMLWSGSKPEATARLRNTNRGWNTYWSSTNVQQTITIWTTGVYPLPPQTTSRPTGRNMITCWYRWVLEPDGLKDPSFFSFISCSLSSCLCVFHKLCPKVKSFQDFQFSDTVTLFSDTRKHSSGWLADQTMNSRANL